MPCWIWLPGCWIGFNNLIQKTIIPKPFPRWSGGQRGRQMVVYGDLPTINPGSTYWYYGGFNQNPFLKFSSKS